MTTVTLTSPSLHAPPPPLTLPFDLIPEILCWLPVKLLIQLQCVCKKWKILISDPKFTRKHLQISKTSQNNHHIIVTAMNDSRDVILLESPISSIFSHVSTTCIKLNQLKLPKTIRKHAKLEVYSCDGLLCFTVDGFSAFLWNPCIRKFKELPVMVNQAKRHIGYGNVIFSLFSFGYDCFSDTYKVVNVSFFMGKNEVSVHTLGTYSWTSIQDFPCRSPVRELGVFLNGAIHWLAKDTSFHAIVSLEFENESYRKLPLPSLEDSLWNLGVLRDCLCISACSNMFFDVWVMKEYGNKESWTNLYHVPYKVYGDVYPYTKVVYVSSEDDRVLLAFRKMLPLKLVVYDSKNDTSNVIKWPKVIGRMGLEVYVESLISPRFKRHEC